MRIKLVGSVRYSLRGELFEKGFEYDVNDDKARVLLGLNDDYGRPYFTRVEKPAPKRAEVEEELLEDGEKIRVRRRRVVGEKNAIVKDSGDTSTLDDEDRGREPVPQVVTDEGIEV